jgi:hypothetical protein
MNTVSEFFADLMDKVTFTSADTIDKEAFGTWNGEKVRLSFRFKVNSLRTMDYPIQVVIRLDVFNPNAQGRESKWTNLTMWGCVDNEENAIFLKAFTILGADLYSKARRIEDKREEMLKTLWNQEILPTRPMRENPHTISYK